MSDDLVATLAGIRERSAAALEFPMSGFAEDSIRCCTQSAMDVPLLLGAVERLLEDHRPGRIVIYGSLCRHHENHRYFSITSTEADDVRACPDCTATVYASCTGCGPQVSADACPVRATIGRGLAGKDGSDGQ